MGITLEPIAFDLRAGPEHEKHGDPWAFGCTVVKVGKMAYLKAGRGDLPPIAEIRAALIDAGFTHVKWERINDEQKKTTLIQL